MTNPETIIENSIKTQQKLLNSTEETFKGDNLTLREKDRLEEKMLTYDYTIYTLRCILQDIKVARGV